MSQTSPSPRKKLKALQPIEGKDGKTRWKNIGVAFPNRDNSINVYLDSLPPSGKIQLREFDEDDLRQRDLDGVASRPRLAAAATSSVDAGEDLPF
jgi:hypothetical protein